MINRAFSDYAVKRISLSPGANLPPKPVLTKENSRYIFPFTLISGYINSTDAGLSSDNFVIDSFSEYERIYTGIDNIIARWDDSTRCYLANPTDAFLTKEFKVGKHLRAVIRRKQSQSEFSTNADGFATQREIKTYSATIYDEFTDADQFKLFVVPQLEGFQWLEASDITNYYNANGSFYKCELLLTSLGDKVAKSGRALQEFVLYGAPGDGYAFPLVNDDDSVVVDPVRACDVPITGFQIELMGAAAFITAEIHGRPTINKTENGITTSTFNPHIEAPRRLLAKSILTPRPSATNTKPSYNTDLFFLANIQPTLELWWSDWKTRFNATYDKNIEAEYEGVIQGETLGNVRKTNPTDPTLGGKRKYAMNDPSWTIPTSGMSFDTRYSGLTATTTLALPAQATPAEIINHMSFGLQALTTLPMNITDNLVVRISDIPIIGGFVNKILLGVDPGWTTSTYKFNLIKAGAFVPTEIVEFGHKQIRGSGDESDLTLLPFDIFANGDNPFQKNAGISSKSLIVAFDLTDTFTNGSSTTAINTLTLGQKNGSKWQGDSKPAARSSVGFVVDATIIKTIGKCQARITYYSNEFSVWSGVYQTQSLYTGNVRDITTAIKHSAWSTKENVAIAYPAAIVAPTPPLDDRKPEYVIQAFAGASVELNAANYTLYGYGNSTSDPNETFFFNANRIPSADLIDRVPPYYLQPKNTYTDNNVVVKTYSYDTAELGGMTAFLRDYGAVRVRLPNGYEASFQTDALTTQGSATLTLATNELINGTAPLAFGTGLNGSTREYRTLTDTRKALATFRTDGNLLKLDVAIGNSWTWSSTAQISYRQSGSGQRGYASATMRNDGSTAFIYYPPSTSWRIESVVAVKR